MVIFNFEIKSGIFTLLFLINFFVNRRVFQNNLNNLLFQYFQDSNLEHAQIDWINVAPNLLGLSSTK